MIPTVFLSGLLCSGIATGFVYRDERTKVANFEDKHRGQSLMGHVIQTLQVSSRFDCAMQCTSHEQCRSYNYQDTSPTQTHTCELNDRSHVDGTGSLKPRTGYSYFASRFESEKCDSCHEESTCLEPRDRHVLCVCAEGKEGRSCEQWKSDAADFSLTFDRRSVDDFVKIEEAIAAELSQLTACLWARYNESRSQTFLSYSTKNTPDELKLSCESEVCNITINGTTHTMTTIPLNDDQWHHVCITWSNTAGDWELHIDGVRRNNNTSFAPAHLIGPGGAFVLGQGSRAFMNSDDEDTFVGALFGVDVWDKVLSEENFTDFVKSEVHRPGNTIDWRSFKGQTLHGDVKRISPSEKSVPKMSIAHFPNKDITSKLSLAAITKNPLTEVSISLWAQLPVVSASQSRTAFTFIDSSNASTIALRFTTKGIFELDIHGSLRMLHGPPVVDGKWHHYGITWRSNDGHVEIHADGILRLSQTGFATGHTLPAGGTMVLGQSYRVLNGALNQDSDLNFHGNLTSVNIWSRLLGGLSMAALSKGTGLESGDVISWKNLAKEDNKMGNVTLQAHDDIRSPVRSVDFYLDFGAVKSTSNYGRFPGTFPDLEAFTLSIWVNRPKAEESGLVAYSIPGVPDYFGLYHKSDTLSISLLNKWLYFPITPFAANGWVWFGWQWRKSDGRTLCYIGDTLVKNGTYEVGSTMQGGGILILGHELDAHGGGFQTSQVLTGHMSHFNVWSVFLDNSDLMALHRGGDAFEGDVVPWSIFRSTGSYFGAIKVVEYSPCTSQTASVMALRSSWCEKFINDVGPFVTLCDRKLTIKTRLLRCYIAGSLQKDANGLFWSTEGSLLYTRNEELRIIHD